MRLAALMAFEDFKYGCTISRNFPIEVLLYYHLTTQISKALELSRKEIEGEKTAYFADIEIPPETLWVTDLTPNICLYKLVERSWISKAMQIRYYKRKRCKK
ncbi:hypothetical protein EYM_03745 [Ignicoccus islandicus DSM 13165]|uniref:Uncharacterized protein n=1 Tax=Ignicoccus islandicus DSM 13165 TaxID=940295 RepID=A0A0U3F8X0_9CREN|nr:hypothetical protein EYM_03745 [Ignicoccus islandicus DSM 13165]